MDDPRAAQAIQMYQDGSRYDDICTELRCGRTTFAKWLRASGARMRGGGLGPNASFTKDGPSHFVRADEERWDMDHLIAVSEARNALTAACGCNGFVTPYFAMPSAEMAVAA